jgi:hypothetical protein
MAHVADSLVAGGDPSRGAGAPEAEIEVTPVMIAAGVRELAWYSDDYESKEDAVERIFAAMFAAMPDCFE